MLGANAVLHFVRPSCERAWVEDTLLANQAQHFIHGGIHDFHVGNTAIPM
jgi:hypothetical protein